MELVATIGGWGVAIVLGLIALLPRKGTIENTRIDQLQEDLAAEREERKALGGEVAAEREGRRALELEVSNLRTELLHRNRSWILHYDLIKQGVEAGTIPPWPDLPDILGGSND